MISAPLEQLAIEIHKWSLGSMVVVWNIIVIMI